MAANKIYVKETAETGKTRIVFAGDILFDSHYAIMASLLKRGQGIEGGISADLLSIIDHRLRRDASHVIYDPLLLRSFRPRSRRQERT